MTTPEKQQGVPAKTSIMFVCLGNICRSPAAHWVLESMVKARKMEERIFVDSAGTASYHIGKLPDRRMIEAAARRGYNLTSRAKAISLRDLGERQLVLAMDRDNLADIRRVMGGEFEHVRLLSDFLDASWPRDVPDPYYGDGAGFEYVLDMLEAASPKILEQIDR